MAIKRILDKLKSIEIKDRPQFIIGLLCILAAIGYSLYGPIGTIIGVGIGIMLDALF